MNSISDLNYSLKKQKILRIKAENEFGEEKRRLNDIQVLCRLLNDDNNDNNNNNNAKRDELSDLSTIESSTENSRSDSSDCRLIGGSSESLNNLFLEESLLSAEIQELSEKENKNNENNNEEKEEDLDLEEFTRIERELKVSELNKCLENIRKQIIEKVERNAPLAESEESLSEESKEREFSERNERSLRPLTLYMPRNEEDLDSDFSLEQHIRELGHEFDSLRNHVLITKFNCFGYLNKLCQNSENNWRKRFFLFDRKNKRFVYFRTKRQFEKNQNPKGGVPFQSIHDVYVDHERSQQLSSSVFVVRTSNRLFVLSSVGNKPEIMRLWIDVIVTGAQAYQHFSIDF